MQKEHLEHTGTGLEMKKYLETVAVNLLLKVYLCSACYCNFPAAMVASGTSQFDVNKSFYTTHPVKSFEMVFLVGSSSQKGLSQSVKDARNVLMTGGQGDGR